jgi:hypothetical protein
VFLSRSQRLKIICGRDHIPLSGIKFFQSVLRTLRISMKSQFRTEQCTVYNICVGYCLPNRYHSTYMQDRVSWSTLAQNQFTLRYENDHVVYNAIVVFDRTFEPTLSILLL